MQRIAGVNNPADITRKLAAIPTLARAVYHCHTIAETHTRQDSIESVSTTGIFHDNLGEDISIPNGSDKYSHIKEYGTSGLVLQAANIQPDNMLNP